MFKPGFFGKNPPRLFVGQVPLNQIDNRVDKNKWGDRVKVRIVGYHPKDGDILHDDDLPWAIVLRPTSQGTLNRGSTGLVGGEWVVGFFLDDDFEKPMIIGILGRTDPSYSVTLQDQQNQGSTQFKKTLGYFGGITAQVYHVKSGPKAGQSVTVPSASDFGLRT